MKTKKSKITKLMLISFTSVMLFSLTGCAPTAPEPIFEMDRYTKKKANGDAIALDDGPWACVEDNKTGLHWEVKSINENLQFSRSTFRWKLKEAPIADAGGCSIHEENASNVKFHDCETADIIQHVNQKKLCGFDDWRLPSALEIRSIMIKHDYPSERKLPFPLLPRVIHAAYWTADVQELDGQSQALTVHFGNNDEHWANIDQVANVILVRGQKLQTQ
jgi:hypothetical protein